MAALKGKRMAILCSTVAMAPAWARSALEESVTALLDVRERPILPLPILVSVHPTHLAQHNCVTEPEDGSMGRRRERTTSERVPTAMHA